MPITFEVHEAESYFVSRWRGRIGPDEAIQTYFRFYDGGEWKPSFDELTDFSEADMSAFKSSEMMGYAKMAEEAYAERGATAVRVAVFAPSVLPYGLVRVYQAWTEESPETVGIFKDFEEALAWLRRRPAPGT